jgi:hypothetical protein
MTYFFALLTKTYFVRYSLFKLCKFILFLKFVLIKILKIYFFRLCCLTHLMDWATSEEAVPLHC